MSLLELIGVSKRYGETVALDDVSLRIGRGEIVGILGENGAGKSTLARICFGLVQPDRGQLRWNGDIVRVHSPRVALRLGISMVQQRPSLVRSMTVAENLILARSTGVWSPRKNREGSIRRMSDSLGTRADLSSKVASLHTGGQQQVSILLALASSAHLLILDEPTSSLDSHEINSLFSSLRDMRASGSSVLFVTHKVQEALAICDRIVVMRSGRVANDYGREEFIPDSLSTELFPSGMRTVGSRVPGMIAEKVMESPLLAALGQRLGNIHSGEVVGLVGVDCATKTNIIDSLVGLRKDAPLNFEHHGAMVNVIGWDIGHRIQWGLAYIPGDRYSCGLALGMSVIDNYCLGRSSLPSAYGWVDERAARSECSESLRAFDVTYSSLDADVATMSGGNQQRLLLARELRGSPRFILAVNPTQGLDEAGVAFVHLRIQRLSAEGAAALLVTADIDEALRLCNRVLVMFGGNIVGEVIPGITGDRFIIAHMMTGMVSQ